MICIYLAYFTNECKYNILTRAQENTSVILSVGYYATKYNERYTRSESADEQVQKRYRSI